MRRQQQSSTLFPYTTLFRSTCCFHSSFNFEPTMRPTASVPPPGGVGTIQRTGRFGKVSAAMQGAAMTAHVDISAIRSEEHTSELQSHSDLVCRLLPEKKKN